MKKVFLVLVGVFALGHRAFALTTEPKNVITLKCDSESQRNYLNISNDLNEANIGALTITRTQDSDCANRDSKGFICFQSGQLMLNVPVSLLSGKYQGAVVWINYDTDDDESDDRLGTPFMCSVVK